MFRRARHRSADQTTAGGVSPGARGSAAGALAKVISIRLTESAAGPPRPSRNSLNIGRHLDACSSGRAIGGAAECQAKRAKSEAGGSLDNAGEKNIFTRGQRKKGGKASVGLPA